MNEVELSEMVRSGEAVEMVRKALEHNERDCA
jgi:hypothetical protein